MKLARNPVRIHSVPTMLRLCLFSLLVGSCAASPFEVLPAEQAVSGRAHVNVVLLSASQALSKVPVVSSLGAQLRSVFPDQPQLAIDKAIASGLVRALGDEGLDLEEVSCKRDYSRLCPEGAFHCDRLPLIFLYFLRF